ncbi:MAG: TPM domain-containing protein [Sphingobacteriales bacterium]|nr:MAG: TPM domain-containing protein [Sphingobacteriales bacterium]
MKTTFKTFLACLSILSLLIVNISFAQSDSDFPKPMNPPRLVNDFAGVLSAQDNQDLEQKLRAYEDSTSTEIAVVTLKSIGMFDIADYSFKLGNRWGIGKKGKKNGVLILAAINDRKLWIATGYGLEGALPDGLVGRIIRNEITPFFKSGNYYQGFVEGTEAIVKAASGEYKADPSEHQEEGFPIGAAVLILIIMVVIIIAATRGGGGNGRGGRYISRRGTDIFTGGMIGGILGGGGSSSGGGGFGGGGFGGFGGGSFGGGGAGGSW